jgi:phage I-like protein
LIKQVGDKWCVFSKDGSKSLGCNPDGLKDEDAKKAWAHKRLGQVEFFKRQLESESDSELVTLADDESLLYELADSFIGLEDPTITAEDFIVKELKSRKKSTEGGQLSEPIVHTRALYLLGEPGEQSGEKWIDLVMDGDYVSMDGSPVSITTDSITKYMKNFDEGVRGQDVPITIDHPDKGGAAGGWIKKLRSINRQVGDATKTCLQALVKWTPLGQEKIDNREYRYVSAELLGNVLRAASLVNFPAIKGMMPVVDLGENQPRHIYLMDKPGGKNMPTQKTLSEKEDAIADAMAHSIMKKVQENLDPYYEGEEENVSTEVTENTQALSEKEAYTKDQVLQLIEAITEEKVKPLAEENARLKANFEESSKLVSNLMVERRLAKLQERVDKVSRIDSTKKLSPKITGMMLDAVQADPKDYEEKFFTLMEAMKEPNAIVDLSEVGSARTENGVPARNTTEWSQAVDTEAKKLLSENNNMKYKDAVKEASRRMMEKGG